MNNFKESMLPTLNYVNSSNILGVGYDSNDLYVMFINKKCYKYKDVNVFDYKSLLFVDSPGKYLSENIKKKYEVELCYEVLHYQVRGYRETKIVITDLDKVRDYVVIDGIVHQFFDPSPVIEEEL